MNRGTPAMRARQAARAIPDPWELVWGQPWIDSETLAAAIADDLRRTPNPDFRTRLLIRDAARALRSFWGRTRFARWLAESPAAERIRAILREDLGEPGFPHIRRRLVASITPSQIQRIFDLLGRNIHERIDVHIAGSITTLLAGLTARPTEDIDFVDEVPEPIRQQRATLDKIEAEFGLILGHVQSHYLPARWEQRRHWLGEFGGLRVWLVDVYDVFVSKLSSRQEKHQQDLRVLADKLDKEAAKRRLLEDGQSFLADPHERPQIEENWRFIYQEPLFTEEAGAAAEEEKPAAPPAKKCRKKSAKKGRKKGGRDPKPPTRLTSPASPLPRPRPRRGGGGRR
jgi:hypothetical protein